MIGYHVAKDPIDLTITITRRIGSKPGMLVEHLDRSWLDTPFLRYTMTITSTTQVAQLKARGVQTLVVRTDGKDGETVEDEPLSKPDIATDPALVAQLETPHRTITAILDPKQASINPTDYLDKRAAKQNVLLLFA